LASLLLVALSPGRAAPLFEKTVVWSRGEAGCTVFNAFSLAELTDGSILAMAEGRHTPTARDHDPMHIVMKRSRDSGRTWGPSRFFRESRAGEIFHNPTMVVDRASGRLIVWYAECDANLSS